MVTFNSNQITTFAKRIKECLINEDCRNELRLFLKKYNRTPLLKVLKVYDKMCEITLGTTAWNDAEICDLLAVSGLSFPTSSDDKPENIKEQCYDKLEVVHGDFIQHLKDHNNAN